MTGHLYQLVQITKILLFCAHDLINTNVNSDTVWNQFHVRSGKISLGYWEIFVENAGYYKFQFRGG